jgi:preprotein translocase subunit SecG
MFVALGIVIIIVCVLLSFIVLIQNPKGGGVSAAFGGVSNQILGAGRSTDVVEKFTWYFAIALLVLCLGSVMVLPEGKLVEKEVEMSDAEKALKENGMPTSGLPTAAPVAPATMPTPAAPAQNAAPVQK